MLKGRCLAEQPQYLLSRRLHDALALAYGLLDLVALLGLDGEALPHRLGLFVEFGEVAGVDFELAAAMFKTLADFLGLRLALGQPLLDARYLLRLGFDTPARALRFHLELAELRAVRGKLTFSLVRLLEKAR